MLVVELASMAGVQLPKFTRIEVMSPGPSLGELMDPEWKLGQQKASDDRPEL